MVSKARKWNEITREGEQRRGMRTDSKAIPAQEDAQAGEQQRQPSRSSSVGGEGTSVWLLEAKRRTYPSGRCGQLCQRWMRPEGRQSPDHRVQPAQGCSWQGLIGWGRGG